MKKLVFAVLTALMVALMSVFIGCGNKKAGGGQPY